MERGSLHCSDNTPYEKVGDAEPVSIADEVPFDIPDSWEWIRFKNLVEYNMGKTPPRKESEYWDKAALPVGVFSGYGF